MKFVMFTKHCNYIWLNFDKQCEEFENYHIANEFFPGIDGKYEINKKIDKNSFSNERWYEMWSWLFFKFPFQMFLGWLIQTKN